MQKRKRGLLNAIVVEAPGLGVANFSMLLSITVPSSASKTSLLVSFFFLIWLDYSWFSHAPSVRLLFVWCVRNDSPSRTVHCIICRESDYPAPSPNFVWCVITRLTLYRKRKRFLYGSRTSWVRYLMCIVSVCRYISADSWYSLIFYVYRHNFRWRA